MSKEFWIGKRRKPVFRCADCNVVVSLHPGHRSTIYIGEDGRVEFAWCTRCARKQDAAREVFGKRRRSTT